MFSGIGIVEQSLQTIAKGSAMPETCILLKRSW